MAKGDDFFEETGEGESFLLLLAPFIVTLEKGESRGVIQLTILARVRGGSSGLCTGEVDRNGRFE